MNSENALSSISGSSDSPGHTYRQTDAYLRLSLILCRDLIDSICFQNTYLYHERQL